MTKDQSHHDCQQLAASQSQCYQWDRCGSARRVAVWSNAAPPDNWYGKKDSLTPFAKAFYHRDTDYFVIPLTFIVMGNAVWQVHGYGRSGDDQQFFSSLAS